MAEDIFKNHHWYVHAISRFEKKYYFKKLNHNDLVRLITAGTVKLTPSNVAMPGYYKASRWHKRSSITVLTVKYPDLNVNCFFTESELENMGFQTIKQMKRQADIDSWMKAERKKVVSS